MSGRKTLATVEAGTELTALEVENNWVGVAIKKGGKEISGWIDRKHLRVLSVAPTRKPRDLRAAKRPEDATAQTPQTAGLPRPASKTEVSKLHFAAVYKSPEAYKGKKVRWHGTFNSMKGTRVTYIGGKAAASGDPHYFIVDYGPNGKPTRADGWVTGTVAGAETIESAASGAGGLRVKFKAVPLLTNVTFEATTRGLVPGKEMPSAAAVTELFRSLAKAAKKPITPAEIKTLLKAWDDVRAASEVSLALLRFPSNEDVGKLEADPAVKAAAAKHGTTVRAFVERWLVAMLAAGIIEAGGLEKMEAKVAEAERGPVPKEPQRKRALALAKTFVEVGKALPPETYEAVRPFTKKMLSLAGVERNP